MVKKVYDIEVKEEMKEQEEDNNEVEEEKEREEEDGWRRALIPLEFHDS